MISKEDLRKVVEVLNEKIPVEKDPYELLDKLKTRGDAHYYLQRWREALIDYSRVMELNPYQQDADLFQKRGDSFYHLGEFRNSVMDYTKSINLNPSRLGYKNRGNAYFHLGEYRSAIIDHSKVIDFHPNDPNCYCMRGLSFSKLNEFEKAVQDFSKALILNPTDYKIHFERGIAYENLKDYRLAIEDFSKKIQFEPSAPCYNSRGFCYVNVREFKNAVGDFSNALHLDPLNPKIFANRGLAYRNLEEYRKAIEDYNRAIDLDPQFSVAYNNRGSVYGLLHEFEKATKDYSKSIEIDPDDPSTFFNRGTAFEKRNDLDNSIKDYSMAIQRNPHFTNALYRRGIVRVWRSLGVNPNRLEYYHQDNDLSFVNDLESHRDELKLAVEDFSECIRLEPRNTFNYLQRSKIFEVLGQKELSERDFRTWKEFSKDMDQNVIPFEELNYQFEFGFLDEFNRELLALRKRLKSVRFKDLNVVKRLGDGAYGHTYLCHVNGVEGEFVLKIYHQINVSKKLIELRKRDTLYVPFHTNLVMILSHSDDDVIDTKKLPDYEGHWKENGIDMLREVPIILMKYYPGDLKTFLAKTGSISALKTCRILQGILGGVKFIHERMIVHRDLHPGNVLHENESDRVWICDFGCSLDLRENPSKFKVQREEEIMFSYLAGTSDNWKFGGAESFLPPEIVNNYESDVFDYSKCDLFSVGVIGNLLLKKTSKLDQKEYDLVSKFLQKFVVQDVSKRIGMKEAVIGIRELIQRLQSSSTESLEEKEEVEDGIDDEENEGSEGLDDSDNDDGSSDEDDEDVELAIRMSLGME